MVPLNDEFLLVIYVPPRQENGPSMHCWFCRKRNESSKRMVWLSVPFCKDSCVNTGGHAYHADAVQAEAIASIAKHTGGIATCIEATEAGSVWYIYIKLC